MQSEYANFRLRIEDKLKDFCWVNHENKIIFFVIPKNASTSIRKSILMSDSYRTTYSLLQKKVNVGEYTTFTVLREPIERLVSGYYEVIRGNKEDNPYNTVANKKFINIDNEPERFICFLEEIEESGYFDSHIKPQIYFLSDEDGNEIDIQHYLFFDNIGDDFSKLCLSLNFNNELQDENAFAKSRKKTLLNYIKTNKKILNSINKLYYRDIIFYNEKNNSIK
tara:strand:- start:1703 stop:2371 length:669 start_codon:yes stop_codon:yes gene_type:complete